MATKRKNWLQDIFWRLHPAGATEETKLRKFRDWQTQQEGYVAPEPLLTKEEIAGLDLPEPVADITTALPEAPPKAKTSNLKPTDWPKITGSPEWKNLRDIAHQGLYEGDPKRVNEAAQFESNYKKAARGHFWNNVVIFDERYKGKDPVEKDKFYARFHELPKGTTPETVRFMRTGEKPVRLGALAREAAKGAVTELALALPKLAAGTITQMAEVLTAAELPVSGVAAENLMTIAQWGEDTYRDTEKLPAAFDIRASAENWWERMAFNLGGGIVTLGEAGLATVATGNPWAASILFGMRQNVELYMDARSKGVDPLEAIRASLPAGVTEGALEFAGLHFLFKKYSSRMAKMLVNAITEFGQEWSQETSGNIFKMFYDEESRTWDAAFKGSWEAGLLGFVLGGGAGVAADIHLDRVAKKAATDAGLEKGSEGWKFYVQLFKDKVTGIGNQLLDIIKDETGAARVGPEEEVAPEEAVAEEDERRRRGAFEPSEEQVRAFEEEEVKPPKAEKILGKPKAKKVTVREDVALRKQLRGERRAAAEGYYEGRRQGRQALLRKIQSKKIQAEEVQALLKEHVEKLPQAYRARIMARIAQVKTTKGMARVIQSIESYEQKAAQKEAQDKLQKITQKLKDTGRLRPEFKGLADEILAGLDPKKPSKKKLRQLASMRRHIEANPEHTIPDYALKEMDRLSQKAISDMKPDEADAVREILTRLNDQSSMKTQKLRKVWQKSVEKQSGELQDELIEQIARAVAKGKKLPTETVAGVKEEATTLSRLLEIPGVFHIKAVSRLFRIFRSLDGGNDGAHIKYFWRVLDDATQERNQAVWDTLAAFDKILKDFSVNLPTFMNEQYKINERKTLTSTAKIEVYLATLRPGKLAHLMQSNDFTDKDIQDTMDALTTQERVIGNWLLDYYSKQYDPIAKIYTEATGRTLPREADWSPITLVADESRKYGETREFNESFMTELASNALTGALAKTRVRHQVERGFTKRQEGDQYAVNLDALGNFTRNVNRFEHYKAFYLPVRDIQALLKDQSWRKLILAQPNGKHILPVIEKWFNDVAKIGPLKAQDELGGMFGLLRRNAAVAFIGLNFLSAVRAGSSIFHSIGYGGHKENLIHHMESALYFASHPIQAWNEASALWPQLVLRFEGGIQRELRQLAAAHAKALQERGLMGEAKRFKRKLDKIALTHYRYIDGVTCRIAAFSHYKWALQTMSEPEARRYAWEAVENTQPMGDEKDLPHFWRGSEVAKMLSQFQSMVNQEYNIIFHDIPAAWKTSKTLSEKIERTVWTTVWSNIIPMMLFAYLGKGFRRMKKDELAKEMIAYEVNHFFGIGSLLSTSMKGFAFAPPALAWGQDVRFIFVAKKWDSRIRSMLKLAGKVGGFPTAQPWRTVPGIIDLAKGDTTDFRRLIWSKYSLKEKKTRAEKAAEKRRAGKSRRKKTKTKSRRRSRRR